MRKRKQPWPVTMADLIRRRGGASLNELCTALGWQAKSVRAGISKLRAVGMQITSYKHFKHGRVYVAKPRGKRGPTGLTGGRMTPVSRPGPQLPRGFKPPKGWGR